MHVVSFWLATGAHRRVYLKGPWIGILLFCSLEENVDVSFFLLGKCKNYVHGRTSQTLLVIMHNVLHQMHLYFLSIIVHLDMLLGQKLHTKWQP